MRTRIYFIIFLLTCKICNAQNLISNGSFESYSTCPNNISQLDYLSWWTTPTTNIYNVSGTPDFFHQCSFSFNADVPSNLWGYQYAHTGGGYVTIGLFQIGSSGGNFREYIQAEISTVLIANACYHFEMYISLPEVCKYTTDDVGIYFSDTEVFGINNWFPLPFTPQISNIQGNYPDTVNWTPVSLNYTAQGGEKYIIIGNFKYDAFTDTVFTNSSGMFIGAYIYIDDVSLTLCTSIDDQVQNNGIKIYPNPIVDKLHVEVLNNELAEIILYDIASRKIVQQQFVNSISINTGNLLKGIYLYEVKSSSGFCTQGKVVKY